MVEKTAQYYVDVIDKGIKLYWRTLGKARDMKIHSGDIEWAVSDDREGPERIFSIDLSSSCAEQRIDEIIQDIRNDALPDGILVTPASRPLNLIELLASKGFELDYSSPGMVMELTAFEPGRQADDSIQAMKVYDTDLLKKWVDIVNLDFHIMSYEQFHDIFCLPYVSLYLSMYEGTPVGTFMIVRDGMLITVEMVNTIKEYQRKGIASAALGQILSEHKAAGADVATLRSSTEGIRLYNGLGFKEYCRRILATYKSGV